MVDRSGFDEEVFGKGVRSDLEVVLDTEIARLSYDARYKIVHHEFRSFVHGHAFREVLDAGLDLLRARGARKWLSDDHGNGPITPADGEWGLHNWAPRAIAAGWQYWAVVLPEKVLGQMNMRRWVETYSKLGVVAQAFTNLEEARAWLRAQ
jgi:hypothetical protein